jgi:hypothetical protein
MAHTFTSYLPAESFLKSLASHGSMLWVRFCCGYFLTVCFFCSSTNAQETNAELVDYFETNVRPLLEEKCIACHSAESGKTSGGLSLSSRGGWELGGDNGAAIKPGLPDQSLLIQAVTYANADLAMPPSDAGGKLSEREIDLLKQWIKTGAIDPRTGAESPLERNRQQAKQWWAFQPLSHPTLPDIHDSTWNQTPLDAFVRAEQLKHGVAVNSSADRRTWIRRATYDLTGLPPSLADIEAFENDFSPDAYERVIERLLDSPAYGEQWGRHWLDIARYADTAGDGADYPVREAYLYRNWVIDAIGSDLPIDQFLSMQIAGDILAKEDRIQCSPERFAEHIIATGFWAVGKRYGYAPNPDYQHLDFADALDSVGRSILGLSIGCARCHDHKYDPISEEDYYAWYGILQSTQWAFPGGEEHKRPAHFPALIPEQKRLQAEAVRTAKMAEIEKAIRQLRLSRNQLVPGYRAGGIDLDLEQQKANEPPSGVWLSAGPNSVLAEAQSPYLLVHPLGKQGVRVGTGKSNDGVRYVFENTLNATDVSEMHFHIEFRTQPDDLNRGAYRFYLGRGVIASTALDFSVTNSELAIMQEGKWQVVRALEASRWYALTVKIDIKNKKIDLRVYDGQQTQSINDLQINSHWDGIIDTFICDGLGHVEGPAPSRDLDNIGLSTVSFQDTNKSAPVAVAAKGNLEELARLENEIKLLQAELDQSKSQAPYPVAYGVVEGTPVDVPIQKRGEPDKLGAVVARRNLEILGGDQLDPQRKGSGRLELARWLVDPKNPLTPRVFVNRVWQWHFGQGLVRTPSDFGLRGEEPTHPELLDWLTTEFINSGWSLKHLHRLIMKSRTYQLSAADNSEMQAIDPSNRWYWKFQRRPLAAEELRDSVMQVAGILNPTQPEGHPFPDVNSWGFTIHNPFHAVYDSEHRSVYLMKQRNRRHPYLTLFDGADPNQSQATRSYSITPTQSLFLMNSPFIVKHSEAFSQRVLAISSEDDVRIVWAVEMTTGYKPPQAEIEAMKAFLRNYSGATTKDASVSNRMDDTKAWAALARVLLTSNAFLFVD